MEPWLGKGPVATHGALEDCPDTLKSSNSPPAEANSRPPPGFHVPKAPAVPRAASCHGRGRIDAPHARTLPRRDAAATPSDGVPLGPLVSGLFTARGRRTAATSEAISWRVRSPSGLHFCSDNSPGPSQPLSATPPPCKNRAAPWACKTKKASACGNPRVCASSPPARKSLTRPRAWPRVNTTPSSVPGRSSSGLRSPLLGVTLPRRRMCGGGKGGMLPRAEPRGCASPAARAGPTLPLPISRTSLSPSPRASPRGCGPRPPRGQRAGSPRPARPGRTQLAPRTRKKLGSRRYEFSGGKSNSISTALPAGPICAPGTAARPPPAPPRAGRTPAGPHAQRSPPAAPPPCAG